MSEVQQADAPTEDVARLGRRRSRFTYIMRRARKDVEADPKLTDDELTQVAAVWLDARQDAATS